MNDPQKPFWTLNIGHIITVVIMVAGFIVFLMKFENRITQIENNERALTDGMNQMRQIVERMDNVGTNASQRGILRDSETAISNTRRIEALEGVTREMIPKVERIDVNVSNLLRQRDKSEKP